MVFLSLKQRLHFLMKMHVLLLIQTTPERKIVLSSWD